jgi:hypothetical protein
MAKKNQQNHNNRSYLYLNERSSSDVNSNSSTFDPPSPTNSNNNKNNIKNYKKYNVSWHHYRRESSFIVPVWDHAFY